MTEHNFTQVIRSLLQNSYKEKAEKVFENSELLKYLNEKTVAANRGSKSRGNFANLYAIYVLVEDYIHRGYLLKQKYSEAEGASFSALMTRQRELPFGSALQNHALNSRANEEFRKFFPTCLYLPIIRDLRDKRYWINEQLLKIEVEKETINIAPIVIAIIDNYVEAKQKSFIRFIKDCQKLQKLSSETPTKVKEYILSLLAPEVDARIFEIVTFAILKKKYSEIEIWWGYEKTNLQQENLKLYKTGRTNANDGGIDFVMKPLGRFFQVTETLDFKKYFLDIDKLEHYPITFVVKSAIPIPMLKETIKNNAMKAYGIDSVVNSYMNCIEELINIPVLQEAMNAMKSDDLHQVLTEIIQQSHLEYNLT